MALATFYSFLMKGSGTGSLTYSKLIDIKDFPDLIGAPEPIDVTNLSQTQRTYIPGVKANDALTFTANYTATDFSTLQALEGTETDFAVWLGATVSGSTVTPDGSDGKFSFKGKLTVAKKGGGVNEAQEMTITIMPSTEITFSTT